MIATLEVVQNFRTSRQETFERKKYSNFHYHGIRRHLGKAVQSLASSGGQCRQRHAVSFRIQAPFPAFWCTPLSGWITPSFSGHKYCRQFLFSEANFPRKISIAVRASAIANFCPATALTSEFCCSHTA